MAAHWRSRPALSEAAFAKKIGKITELEVALKQTTIFFDAGDCFGDHAIEVRLTPQRKISAINLA